MCDLVDPLIKLAGDYCGNSIDTPVEADESQEQTYVGIDTFLASI